MKHTVLWLIGLTAVLLLAVRVTLQGEEAAPPKVAPLSLDGLLDEKLPEAADAPQKKTMTKVDNSACFVCHVNYQEEELVTVHAQDEVACVRCHGESVDHRNDEDNITPPDTMYGRGQVEQMCSECHDEHDASPYDILQRWGERCAHIRDLKDVVCTDCHFHHRLPRRLVQWDKETRQLIRHTAAAGAAKATAP